MAAGCSSFFALVALGALVVAIAALTRANRAAAHAESLRDQLADLNRWVREHWQQPQPPSPSTPAPEPVPVRPPEPIVVAAPKPSVPAPIPILAKASEPAPPARTASAPPPQRQPRKQFDWEALVGVKLFSWIAGVALVLAAIFFLRYSVEHGWLSPTVRATLGLIAGTGLLIGCELRVARQFKVTVNALDGAGIAILYATLFAIHALWHLLPAAAVFALMLIVTAVAVTLSIRRDSIFIALLGLLGGFATPAMLSTGENRPIGLFSYLLLLNLGLAWVAMNKRWPLLTALTIAFTAFYQWAWIAKFLGADQVPLAAGIFIVFGASAAAALWFGRKPDDAQRKFDYAAVAGATLPLLFALVSAAVPAYGKRYNVLFAFLLLATAGLSIIAVRRGPQWLHLIGSATAILVFGIWMRVSYSSHAWPAILGWTAVFVIAQLAGSHFAQRPQLAAAPLLFFLFPALASVEHATRSPYLLFGALLVLFMLVAAYAIVHDAPILHYAAAFFVIAAEAVWSARYLAPERLIPALAIYGIFALVFLGVPIVARRFGRPFAAGRANSVLLLASIAILFFLAAGAVAPMALWGLALLLAAVNLGALAEARATANASFSSIGLLLSWIVLGVWCGSAIASSNVISALLVIGGFALLAIIGNAWVARHSDTPEEFSSAVFLALAGHLFLMAIAAQKTLSIPPWPLFAVLFVLDLAIGVVALASRRRTLMTAALAGSQLVLMIWASHASVAPWPNIALTATLAVASLGVVWFAMRRDFAMAAIAALFLGDVVAIIAGVSAAHSLFGTLLVAHIVIFGTLLAVAWLIEGHDIAVAAVPLAAIATFMARATGLSHELTFAGAIYALFVAYPLLLGRRAKSALQPYLAAVLASVPFFFFARGAMREARVEYAIGVLPVFQALLMIALLLRILRMEAPAERVLNRLALVAGAALAFITVAIPLQLEKQWITIGWALEAAALVWLFTRIPHRGLLVWSAALFAAVFVRLAFNRAVFSYHPVSHTAIVNWYLYTYLTAAIAFFVAARLLPRIETARTSWAVPALTSCGTVLLFFLVNIEIADFYSRGRALTFNFFSSSLAQDLTYTIGWALFAVAMLVAGIALQSRGARVAAILLLVSTVLKCFLHDLARLGGLYRVGSLLGLAISLVLVGVLLQKFVMVKSAATPIEEIS